MFIYQPIVDSKDRTVWYGGESTQLHYQLQQVNGQWVDTDVRTLGNGIPEGMSEMHAELRDYYNYCNSTD